MPPAAQRSRGHVLLVLAYSCEAANRPCSGVGRIAHHPDFLSLLPSLYETHPVETVDTTITV